MNDPHVACLVYRFRSTNDLDRFSAPTPLDASLDDFDVHLEGGVLTATPLAHFASADDARELLDPKLRAWEAQVRIRDIWHSIRFEFEDANVIDRAASRDVSAFAWTARGRGAAFDPVVIRDNGAYPPPARDFATDPILDSIIGRLEDLDQRAGPD